MLAPDQLTLIVNTGDDFEHLGLTVCPDVDTALYTLGGLANPDLGWGRRDETWNFMQALETLGGETWFQLGDRDLALHVERTRRLARGESLSKIVADVAGRFGIAARVIPASDDKVRTRVVTEEGELAFQDYFVRRCCEPRVLSLRFEGALSARPAAGALSALAGSSIEAIVICPSNPYLSVDPILAIPGLRQALRASGAPIVAVTPIVAGKAIKGPAAKIMQEMGTSPTVVTVARHYEGLIDAMVLDTQDAGLAGSCPCPVHVTDTVMTNLADRERLARAVLGFATTLRPTVRGRV
jgi:LPPG:FO 2-phospho-L-lactate transferase